MTRWHEGPLASFAIESTGPDAERDRIVSAVLVEQHRVGGAQQRREWLIDTGAPVPAGTIPVPGIACREGGTAGWRPGPALEEIARALAAVAAAGTPLVVLDAPSALTLLDRELRRHRGAPLLDYTAGSPLLVLDPRVLDGRLDRCRKGGRTPADLCGHYGVAAGRTRRAADACAVLELARALGRRYAERLAAFSLAELHLRQALWHAAQARGPREWFASAVEPAGADPAWPLREYRGPGGSAAGTGGAEPVGGASRPKAPGGGPEPARQEGPEAA